MEACSRIIAILISALVCVMATDSNIKITGNQSLALFDKSQVAKGNHGLLAKKKISTECIKEYSMTCLKIDLLDFMDYINTKGLYQVTPGLALVRSSSDYRSKSLPPDLIVEFAKGKHQSSKELDIVVLQQLEEFIKTFSVQLQPKDPQILNNIKNTGNEIINTLSAANNSRTGRSRRTSLLWSVGIIAAVGFAALSAVAGKALMASLMALIIAAITAFRGPGAGGAGAALSGYKTAHYEIITKPLHYSAPAFTAPAHYDHVHHGSSYSPVYDYARTITSNVNTKEDEGFNVSEKEVNVHTITPRLVKGKLH